MPDTKISAMPSAASVLNADLVPIVQAGINDKATKALLLTGGAGEDIIIVASSLKKAAMQNNAGSCFVWCNDNGSVLTTGNQGAQLADSFAGARFNITAANNMEMICPTVGKTYTIGCSIRNKMVLDDTTLPGAFTLTCAGPVFIPYTPGAPLNWALPVPPDIWTALDRIAAAIVARTVGGPI